MIIKKINIKKSIGSNKNLYIKYIPANLWDKIMNKIKIYKKIQKILILIHRYIIKIPKLYHHNNKNMILMVMK
jgi:hypothetical protein